MNRTQSRACLAVGSLARQCLKDGQEDMAHRLMDKLEQWLDKHQEGIKIIIKTIIFA